MPSLACVPRNLAASGEPMCKPHKYVLPVQSTAFPSSAVPASLLCLLAQFQEAAVLCSDSEEAAAR